MGNSAVFMVRAVVADPADRPGFDRWYAEEHLPDAHRMFAARSAWRGWSLVDPSVHLAFYEFDDVATMRTATGSPALGELVAEFDKVWGSRVTRAREMIEIAGAISASLP